MADNFKNRSKWVRFVLLAAIFLLILRLGYIQIFDKDYKQQADAQSLREITNFPARGCIYDRNGQLLVYNEAVFDLMVIPEHLYQTTVWYQDSVMKNHRIKKVRHSKDSLIIDTAYLCRLLGITNDDFNDRLAKAKKYSMKAPSIFMKQISKDEMASWRSELYKFAPAFYEVRRTLRRYDRPIGAHLLGYVGEVNDNDIKRDSYYAKGDYIGQSGLERTYEEDLRGLKGKTVMHVNVNSQEIGPYMNGARDVDPVSGNNLYTSIDADLQQYAEKLMANKRGCVVAIEPSTGEILVLVSAPTYDPNLLVGRVRGSNFAMLQQDVRKPLFNRALQAQYPPGSIFKVAQAMTALQMGVITPNTGFTCNKALVGCHNHPSATCVSDAIKMSCNPYFYNVYSRIIQQGKYSNALKDSRYGLMQWHHYMTNFGFGQRLEIDLPGVSKGVIPDTTKYDKWYNRQWTFRTIYSNSIGQGEVEVVPLQMANLAAIVANRGYYYTPHVVRYVGNDTMKHRVEKFFERHETGIDRKYFEIAVEGMYQVVYGAGGTGHRAAVPNIAVCGKTGTAQNKGADHSVFISFAPRDNPKIAMAVYVENAPGGGGTWAAPITSLLIEKYLNRKVERTEFENQYMSATPCRPVK